MGAVREDHPEPPPKPVEQAVWRERTVTQLETWFVSNGSQGELPQEMPRRALMYRWYARTYGWPQRVVDEEISDEMYEWYPLIEEGEHRAAEIERKRAERESRAGRHAR